MTDATSPLEAAVAALSGAVEVSLYDGRGNLPPNLMVGISGKVVILGPTGRGRLSLSFCRKGGEEDGPLVTGIEIFEQKGIVSLSLVRPDNSELGYEIHLYRKTLPTGEYSVVPYNPPF